MPSVTQEQQAFVPSKKRRRDDDTNDGQVHLPFAQDIEHSQNVYALSFSDHHHYHHNQNNFTFSQHQYQPQQQHGGRDHIPNGQPLARKIIPLPIAKRARLYDDGPESCHQEGIGEARGQQQRRQSASSSPRHSKSPSKELQQTSGNGRPAVARTTSAALLSPCHICHRKPTKKSDLDSFADCQGCGQRTCYVCIRQCLGWKVPDQEDDEMPSRLEENLSASFHMEDAPDENHGRTTAAGSPEQKEQKIPDWATGGRGHRAMVCSRCCIERPTDGEIVCFGCLPFVEG